MLYSWFHFVLQQLWRFMKLHETQWFILQLPAQGKPKLLNQAQDPLPAERLQHLCPVSLSIHQRQAGRAGRPLQRLRLAILMLLKMGYEWVNECWGWTPLFPKSHAGINFLHSYECSTAAEASCKCAASPFPIIIHHYTLLPLPVTYVLPVLPPSVSYLFTYFCSYNVFSSSCSQIPSVKK